MQIPIGPKLNTFTFEFGADSEDVHGDDDRAQTAESVGGLTRMKWNQFGESNSKVLDGKLHCFLKF